MTARRIERDGRRSPRARTVTPQLVDEWADPRAVKGLVAVFVLSLGVLVGVMAVVPLWAPIGIESPASVVDPRILGLWLWIGLCLVTSEEGLCTLRRTALRDLRACPFRGSKCLG